MPPCSCSPTASSNNPAHAVDDGLAALATAHAHLPLQDFVEVLADHHPSGGHDGMAILAPGT
ncbi:hypothetical protein ACH4S8_41410 [Streptomyces sp. NPDC021080]|uniref:hypothetical protein n=1 Tax=Streptomyces sp. NPDC021080 TaxID=3365110 RepID=UPI0037B023E6